MTRKHPAFTLILLVVLFLLQEIIIYPLGEFPLNDDWAYAATIKQSIENQSITYHQWMGMSFLIQFVLGWFVTIFSGFSFEHLRCINITIAFLLWCFFYFQKHAHSKSTALILISCAVFNPIFVQQSNTFMTDVLHVALVLFSIHFLFEYFEKRALKLLYISLLFGLVALFQKQITLVYLLSILLYFIVFELKKSRIEILITFTSITISYIALHFYLNLEGIKTINMGIQQAYIIDNLLHPNTIHLTRFVFYLANGWLSIALFLLPATVLFLKKGNLKTILFSLGIGFGSVFFLMLKQHTIQEYLPFTGNILYDLGLGPHVMTGIKDTLPNTFQLGPTFWYIISGISSSLLIQFLVVHYKELKNSSITQFIALFILSYCVLLSLSYFSDRYLILPLFALVFTLLKLPITPHLKNAIKFPLSIIILSGITFFSITSTHDYFAINRARWELLIELKNKGIPPTEIDGGFEYNASYFYKPDKAAMTTKSRFWWIQNDTYIVTPAVLKDQVLMHSKSYFSLMKMNQQYIYTYQKL